MPFIDALAGDGKESSVYAASPLTFMVLVALILPPLLLAALQCVALVRGENLNERLWAYSEDIWDR